MGCNNAWKTNLEIFLIARLYVSKNFQLVKTYFCNNLQEAPQTSTNPYSLPQTQFSNEVIKFFYFFNLRYLISTLDGRKIKF